MKAEVVDVGTVEAEAVEVEVVEAEMMEVEERLTVEAKAILKLRLPHPSPNKLVATRIHFLNCLQQFKRLLCFGSRDRYVRYNR